MGPDLLERIESPPPAYLNLPPRAGSLGDIAIDLAELCGLDLDDHQRLAIDAMQSIDAVGKWACLEQAIVEPRQNGKSAGILLPIALAHAVFVPNQLIVWSAHRYKTAQEAFLAMLRLLGPEDDPTDLGRRVTKRSYSNGEEGFEFDNGSRIIFVARSQASGRGLSGDLVILDEALFLTDAMMGALFPTMSARPNPLIIYASSAGLASSTILQSIRDRGRSGTDPSLVYLEWCAPEAGCASPDCDHHLGIDGCALDNPANWIASNPAVAAGRMTLRYIEAERRALSGAVREFARERLGWWDSASVGGLFHMPNWWKLIDPESAAGDDIRLAVHVTPDRGHSAVAAASYRGDGVLHLELIDHRPGVSWLAPETVAYADRNQAAGVALAGSMAAGSLAPDLEGIVGFQAMNATEVRRACSWFYDAVNGREPLAVAVHPDLDAAVQAAARSSDRGEWVFDAEPGIDLSPLYAVALAGWAAKTGDPAVDVSIFRFDDLGNCDDCDCSVELPPDSAPCLDCGHLHATDDDEDEDEEDE